MQIVKANCLVIGMNVKNASNAGAVMFRLSVNVLIGTFLVNIVTQYMQKWG